MSTVINGHKGHIIRTDKEIAMFTESYKQNLNHLVRLAQAQKVPTDQIIGEMYDYIMISFIQAADDEEFLETVITNFTDTLRYAIAKRKEEEGQDNDTNNEPTEDKPA